MAQYRTGVVNTTQGSNIITGVGTAWTTALVNGVFVFGSMRAAYVVTAVNSATELVISSNSPYTGTSWTYIISVDFTPNANLPLANPGDRMFDALHNDAMIKIDTLLGGGISYVGAVIDKDLNAAPTTGLSDGDAYIVAAGVSTGDDWFGFEDYIATWDASTGVGWIFALPLSGWYAWVKDEAELYWYDGDDWTLWDAAPNHGDSGTFGLGDLTTGGDLVWTHDLNQQYIGDVTVYNDSDQPIKPDWTADSPTQCTVILSGETVSTGETWKITISRF